MSPVLLGVLTVAAVVIQLLTVVPAASTPLHTGFGTLCTTSELAAPPRGWNSYDSSPPWTGPNGSTEASTEAAALRDAARLASTLLQYGYDTFTLDSGWFGEDNKYVSPSIGDLAGQTAGNAEFKRYPSRGFALP